MNTCSQWRNRLLNMVAEQAPANFAMVMATGIVSLAVAQRGMKTAALAMLALNAVLLLSLLTGLGARLALFPRRALQDAAHPLRGPGYFTLPAALCVLGRQCGVLLPNLPGTHTAQMLFGLAAMLWAVFVWGVLLARITSAKENSRQDAPPAINGAWLVAVVSTQGLVVLGSHVFPGAQDADGAAALLMVALFGTGFALYGMLITIILYRLAFFPLAAKDLSPSFWINAGAMAITTLAGCELTHMLHASSQLAALAPTLQGLTIMAWGLSTWWFGLLLPLGIWRHVIQRVPLRYNPEYWGLVFPLGMYTVCTVSLLELTGGTSLQALPMATLGAALLAWTATFCGLARFIFRQMTGRAQNPQAA